MNDIAKPIMNVEKCLRRVSDQIAHGNMTPSQLFITHHAILDAIANLLDAKAWVSDRLSKHTEAPNQTGQPDEIRSVREGELTPGLSQKYQQSELGIQTLQTQVAALQYRVWNIERQLPQSQMQSPLYAGVKPDTQPDIDRALQDIHKRAEAEKNRTMLAQVNQLHVASRSSKVY